MDLFQYGNRLKTLLRKFSRLVATIENTKDVSYSLRFQKSLSEFRVAQKRSRLAQANAKALRHKMEAEGRELLQKRQTESTGD